MSTIDISKILTPEIRAKVKVQRKFEIAVEEMHETDDGRMTWRPVKTNPELGGNGQIVITASSSEDLKSQQQIYAQAGQRFKIIRQIDPPSDEILYKLAIEQGLVSETALTDMNKDIISEQTDNSKHTSNASDDNVQSTIIHTNNMCDNTPHKIRYYSVGDIEIKDDNGTLYQKQWMKLTPAEAANFRIVNDTNNKTIVLNGKHIEAKRWILVEKNNSSDNTVNVDNIING